MDSFPWNFFIRHETEQPFIHFPFSGLDRLFPNNNTNINVGVRVYEICQELWVNCGAHLATKLRVV